MPSLEEGAVREWHRLTAQLETMQRASAITLGVTGSDFVKAINTAAAGHLSKPGVKEALADVKAAAAPLYRAFRDGSWTELISYRQLEKVNNNGKHRKIDCPHDQTRFLQHFAHNVLEPIYLSKDNWNGLNCKTGAGITAKEHRKSVIHRMKSVYFSRADLQYALVIDQRKCYEHLRPAVFRRMLRNLVDDRYFIDFVTDVSFVGGKLPIGTPMSPLAHHITMLTFDIFARELAPESIRYADNCILFFHSKEEAQQAKWRVKNFWWYELGIRAKRQETRIVSLDDPLDFCGYVFHRGGGGHSRGYVGVRKSTLARARRATPRNWGSYFGILQHADCYAEMQKIEREMKLSQLTNKIKLTRNLDAPNIAIKDVLDKEITIVDYELRCDGEGKPNWIKMLVGIPSEDGRIMAREIHGSYQYIVDFLAQAEKMMGGKSALIPIENVVIQNQCGYIFKDSTNQLQFIDENVQQGSSPGLWG